MEKISRTCTECNEKTPAYRVLESGNICRSVRCHACLTPFKLSESRKRLSETFAVKAGQLAVAHARKYRLDPAIVQGIADESRHMAAAKFCFITKTDKESRWSKYATRFVINRIQRRLQDSKYKDGLRSTALSRHTETMSCTDDRSLEKVSANEDVSRIKEILTPYEFELLVEYSSGKKLTTKEREKVTQINEMCSAYLSGENEKYEARDNMPTILIPVTFDATPLIDLVNRIDADTRKQLKSAINSGEFSHDFIALESEVLTTRRTPAIIIRVNPSKLLRDYSPASRTVEMNAVSA